MNYKANPRHDPFWLALLAAGLCALLLGLTGCSALTGGQQRTLRPIVERTNIVETVLVTPASTNTVQTPAGPVQLVTPPAAVTNWQTNVVVEVNPLWQQTISGARTLNETLNPTPTAPFVNIGLSALSGALAWFAAWQTRKRQREAGMLNAVIAGVEAAKNPEVKKVIAETATLFGNDRDLRERVRAVTHSGPNP